MRRGKWISRSGLSGRRGAGSTSTCVILTGMPSRSSKTGGVCRTLRTGTSSQVSMRIVRVEWTRDLASPASRVLFPRVGAVRFRAPHVESPSHNFRGSCSAVIPQGVSSGCDGSNPGYPFRRPLAEDGHWTLLLHFYRSLYIVGPL